VFPLILLVHFGYDFFLSFVPLFSFFTHGRSPLCSANAIQSRTSSPEESVEVAVPHFDVREYGIFLGTAVLVAIQFAWHLTLQKKFSKKTK